MASYWSPLSPPSAALVEALQLVDDFAESRNIPAIHKVTKEAVHGVQLADELAARAVGRVLEEED